MRVKTIKLENFRNYEYMKIEFGSTYNVIYGDNAQGKTNILEAIFLCAMGRSHRTQKDGELLKNRAEGFKVGLEIERDENTSKIEISYEREGRKKIRINEIPVKKTGELMGLLNIVIFSPEDLFIVKEGPSIRRRFIDMTLSQMKPSYYYNLQQYAKVLYQRNMLLKEINIKKELMETLEVWDENLVKTGSKIIKVRKEFMDEIQAMAFERHVSLTGGQEELKLEYVPSVRADKYDEIKDIENTFRNIIESSKKKELKNCITLYGPHRDDFDIKLNGMNTKIYGSQGQQRTSILSIKLAEIDIMKKVINEYPVLLLDDVLSELDSKRQEYLFETVDKIQTIITCTDASFYKKKGVDATLINVVDGKIIMDY